MTLPERRCQICGEPGRLYPGGWLCEAHSPAGTAGRTIPEVDPAMTLDASREDWRVHDTGRVSHAIRAGQALCGQDGRGWRKTSGMPRCGECAAIVAGHGEG